MNNLQTLQQLRTQTAAELKALQEQEALIRASSPRFSQQQLRQTELIQRRLALQGFQQEKAAAEQIVRQKLSNLGSFETELKALQKQYEDEQKRVNQYNLALSVYLGQATGGPEFSSIPEDIRKAAKEESIKLERAAVIPARLKDESGRTIKILTPKEETEFLQQQQQTQQQTQSQPLTPYNVFFEGKKEEAENLLSKVKQKIVDVVEKYPKIETFFKTHRSPQQVAREYFIEHRSPQQVVGEYLSKDKFLTTNIKIPIFTLPGGAVSSPNITLGSLLDLGKKTPIPIPVFTAGPGSTSIKTTAVSEGALSLVPRTPLGLGALTGAIGVFPFLPPLAQRIVSGGITASGGYELLRPGATPGERVAGGIIAGGGLVGLSEGVKFPRTRKGFTEFFDTIRGRRLPGDIVKLDKGRAPGFISKQLSGAQDTLVKGVDVGEFVGRTTKSFETKTPQEFPKLDILKLDDRVSSAKESFALIRTEIPEIQQTISPIADFFKLGDRVSSIKRSSTSIRFGAPRIQQTLSPITDFLNLRDSVRSIRSVDTSLFQRQIKSLTDIGNVEKNFQQVLRSKEIFSKMKGARFYLPTFERFLTFKQFPKLRKVDSGPFRELISPLTDIAKISEKSSVILSDDFSGFKQTIKPFEDPLNIQGAWKFSKSVDSRQFRSDQRFFNFGVGKKGFELKLIKKGAAPIEKGAKVIDEAFAKLEVPITKAIDFKAWRIRAPVRLRPFELGGRAARIGAERLDSKATITTRKPLDFFGVRRRFGRIQKIIKKPGFAVAKRDLSALIPGQLKTKTKYSTPLSESFKSLDALAFKRGIGKDIDFYRAQQSALKKAEPKTEIRVTAEPETIKRPEPKGVEIQSGKQVLIQRTEQIEEPVVVFGELPKVKTQLKIEPQLKLGEVNRFEFAKPSDNRFQGLFATSRFKDLGVIKSRFENLFKDTTKIKQRIKPKDKQVFVESLKQPQDTKQESVEMFKLPQLTKEESLLSVKTPQALLSGQDQAQDQAQAQKERMDQLLKTEQKTETRKMFLLFPKFLQSLRKKQKTTTSTKKGYNVYAKSKKQWLKLNRNTLSKSNAQDLGAYITDTSLAATFKLKRATKQAQQSKLNIPKGYFAKTSFKYRDYKIRNKKRIPLQNSWIEKRGYRLDTPNETRSIQAARKSLMKVKRRGRSKWL